MLGLSPSAPGSAPGTGTAATAISTRAGVAGAGAGTAGTLSPPEGWLPAVRPLPSGPVFFPDAGDQSAAADPWATDPVLDGPLAATLPSREEAEAAAAADAATALEESGFGGALHTALGELRRISDDPVPVYADGAGTSVASAGSGVRRSGSGGVPAWPSGEPLSPSGRFGGSPAEWVASLGDWWTARWRDLLPGMVVAALIIVAFAVVLATGGRRADKSQVNTRRPIASDPSTTIPGLFSTAGLPPGDVPPPGDVASSSSGSSADSSSSPGSPAVAPGPTAKAGSDSSSSPAPEAPAKPSTGATPAPAPPGDDSGPPATNPPATNPPPTTPPVTEPPPTTPPPDDPPPDPPPSIDICQIRPARCPD